MNKRSIIIIAAILTTTVAGCASTAGQGKSTLDEPSARSSLASSRSSPIRRIEERYRDSKGFELVLSTDASGKVKAKAFDPEGKPVEVREVPLENRAFFCLPVHEASSSSSGVFDPAKRNCQPLSFMSDGSFIKLGTTSCVCGVCGGIGYCYGSTCH